MEWTGPNSKAHAERLPKIVYTQQNLTDIVDTRFSNTANTLK